MHLQHDLVVDGPRSWMMTRNLNHEYAQYTQNTLFMAIHQISVQLWH